MMADFSFQLNKVLTAYDEALVLKPKQIQVLQKLWHGQGDMIVSLPTGYGKSVIYHLCGRLLKEKHQHEHAITIVITPLNIIQKDQLLSLAKHNIKACKLDTKGNARFIPEDGSLLQNKRKFCHCLHSNKKSEVYVVDLKAFERRLTEVVAQLYPATARWRLILVVIAVCTATGAWNWIWDPNTTKVSFMVSLWNHPIFAISCLLLLLLFFSGIHKRVVAPSIVASRCRQVLHHYNMSCDDTGKLILKPRPNT